MAGGLQAVLTQGSGFWGGGRVPRAQGCSMGDEGAAWLSGLPPARSRHLGTEAGPLLALRPGHLALCDRGGWTCSSPRGSPGAAPS